MGVKLSQERRQRQVEADLRFGLISHYPTLILIRNKLNQDKSVLPVMATDE